MSKIKSIKLCCCIVASKKILNFDCKLPALPLLIGFVADSVDRILLKRRQSVFPSLRRFSLQSVLNCSILLLPLYIFVVAVSCCTVASVSR